MKKYILLIFLTTIFVFIFPTSGLVASPFDLVNLKGQSLADITAYEKVKIIDVWNFLEQIPLLLSPVSIGIFDTGIDITHPEFRQVSIDTPTIADTLEEEGGHGTQVAGIIGANNISFTGQYIPKQMNGILSGVRNLNYTLKIRFSSDVGNFTLKDEFRYFFVLDQLARSSGGLHIINGSFGAPLCSALSDTQQFWYPKKGKSCYENLGTFNNDKSIYLDLFNQYPDIIFVFGAGNDAINTQFDLPGGGANAINTITVGATDLNDQRASFLPAVLGLEESNFGASVDIAASGKQVYAPTPNGLSQLTYQQNFQGTSASAPMVTGVAGLLKALEPEYQRYTSGLVMTPAKIKEVLIASADPVNTGESDKPLGSGCYHEKPSDTGCRLNAHRAVAWYLPPEPVVLNPPVISPQPFSSSLSLSLAQNLPPSSDSIIRGETSGTGVHFEIKDSDYLNVALESTATIEVFLSSRPKTVSLIIQPSPASSTQLTFSGLIPNKTYYRYDNSFKNGVPFTADDAGRHTFIQNISRAHHIWIQETQGTVFIPEDCNTVGTFNSDTATCALNRNLNNNIEITADNITLDCDNHTLSDGFRWASFGIYLNSRRNVIVRNCSVNNAAIGIAAVFSDNNTFINNRTNGNSVGILLSSSDLNTVSNTNSFANGQGLALNSFSNNNIITNNRFSDLLFGITLNQSRFNRIEANTLTGHSSTGIHITAFSTSNNIINNVISDNFFGIFMLQTLLAQGNTIADNIVNNNRFGISVGVLSPNTKVFHNNFINNTVQAEAFSTSFFDNGLPDGGNFWDNYDTPVEGCNDVNNDKFCDAPFIINSAFGAQDNFPWTIRDGWKAPAKIKVNLSWSKNEDPDFESYRIFRDTNPNVDLTDTLAAKITNQNQISFIDENLDAGPTYFYRIFVFDEAGLSSESNEVSGGM